MKKCFAALCLTCSALLSLSAPAAAVRAPNDSGQPQSSTGNTSVTIPSDGILRPDRPPGKGQQPDLEGGAGEPEIRRGHGLG